MMKFSDWVKLKEADTGTNCIATFARPIGMVTRVFPEEPKKKVSERLKDILLKLLSNNINENYY